VRAGNPDSLWSRLAGGIPIHGAFHHLPHLRKPPAGAGDAPFAARAIRAPTADAGVETQFELFVGRVGHNEPFFARHFGGVGWTFAVQAEEKVKYGNIEYWTPNAEPRIISAISSVIRES
jgi:hypothetical protein